MKKCIQSALVALQFLTQIPVRFKSYPNEKIVAASLLFYPLVGFLIGLGLLLITYLFSHVPSFFAAAIVLSFWVFITGALHLDGLADSCDAWLGGIGNKQRTLDIMKDPYSGPIAVVVLICILLIKYSAIVSLIEAELFILLLAVPLIARCILPAVLIYTPYVRANGIGASLVKNAPQKTVLITMLFGLLFSIWLASFWSVFFAIISAFGLRYLALKRLQGLTGDIAGAVIELVETVVLISLVYSFY